ncbi:hypothetical protein [Pseudomonas anguilliseptica]|uniref:hypothetical protein n=1 Tax=Pseudomonas anguilliseptica TaxID=53406 RepID=UPI0037359C70
MSSPRVVLLALLLAVASCASNPPIQVSASTWQQVDRDISVLSRSAAQQAREHALLSMEQWMDLVYQQTDEEFIPWFSGYWTQQWMGIKVSWYRLSHGGAKEPSVRRLALYLQEQYRERVLEPVAETDDPQQIMARSTWLYLQHLDENLPRIAQQHDLPREQFQQRLRAIPAITQAPGASLYELLHAEPLTELPAYSAFIERIRNAPRGLGDWSADPGISAVAQQTSERLIDDLAVSGAAGAVSALIGGPAGTTVSLGVALFTAVSRESTRPASEAQLRKNLNEAFDDEWLELMRSTEHGVLAGVHQLSGQIERGLRVPFRYQP